MQEDQLPAAVTRIDVARVERAARKMCRCPAPRYSVDTQNHLVYCLECGAIVDPFDALKYIANNWDRVNASMEQQLEERKQIDAYKPRRVVLKALDKKLASPATRDKSPTCPHCGQPFSLADLLTTTWVADR